MKSSSVSPSIKSPNVTRRSGLILFQIDAMYQLSGALAIPDSFSKSTTLIANSLMGLFAARSRFL
jgi:hypothetical protein